MWCYVKQCSLDIITVNFLTKEMAVNCTRNACIIQKALKNMTGKYRAELSQWWAFYSRILSKLKISHVIYPTVTHFSHFKQHIACNNQDVVLRHTAGAIIKVACQRTTSLLLRDPQRGCHTVRYIALNASIIMMYESSNMWTLTVVAGSKSPLHVLARTSEKQNWPPWTWHLYSTKQIC
jgi:hypothetical protein